MNYLSLAPFPRGQVHAGSACLLAAVPQEWIVTWPRLNPETQVMEASIILAEGRSWLPLLLVSRKRIFTEESAKTDSGVAWQQSLTARTAGTSIPIHLYGQNWTAHRWVLLYVEAGSNITYLIGGTDSGANFNIKYTNEVATQSEINFVRSGTHRAIVYQGAYTLDTSEPITFTADVKLHVYNAIGDEGHVFDVEALKGRTILYVSRGGMVDLEPVGHTPTSQTEIQVDTSIARFTVHADLSLSAGETFFILYKTFTIN